MSKGTKQIRFGKVEKVIAALDFRKKAYEEMLEDFEDGGIDVVNHQISMVRVANREIDNAIKLLKQLGE